MHEKSTKISRSDSRKRQSIDLQCSALGRHYVSRLKPAESYTKFVFFSTYTQPSEPLTPSSPTTIPDPASITGDPMDILSIAGMTTPGSPSPTAPQDTSNDYPRRDGTPISFDEGSDASEAEDGAIIGMGVEGFYSSDDGSSSGSTESLSMANGEAGNDWDAWQGEAFDRDLDITSVFSLETEEDVDIFMY